jgi:LPXTG-motif cell wall-anchored protein
MVYLKTLTNEPKPLKEVKPVKAKPQPQTSSNNTFYLISGIVLVVIAVLGIGY